MTVKALLFWLLWCLPDVRNDPINPLANFSFLNETSFGNCSIAFSTSTIVTSDLPSTTPFWTSLPSSFSSPPTDPEETSPQTTPIMTSSSSTDVYSSPSTTTVTPRPISSTSAVETSTLPEELTTSVSTETDLTSVTFSSDIPSTTVEQSTVVDSTSSAAASLSSRTSSQTIQLLSSVPSSVSPSRPTIPSIPTSDPQSSVSLLSILSSQSTESSSSLLPSSSSSNTPTTSFPTSEGKTLFATHSSSSSASSTDLYSTGSASTKLDISTSSQGISTLTPSTSSSSTHLETTEYETTEEMNTMTTAQMSSTGTEPSSGPSKLQSTAEDYTTTPGGTSPVMMRDYPETTSVPSTASSQAPSTPQGESTSTIMSTGFESSALSSEYSSSTLIPTTASSVTSTISTTEKWGFPTEFGTETSEKTSSTGFPTEFGTETSEKTSSTAWRTKTTTVAPTGLSTLSTTTDLVQSTTSGYSSAAPSTETESTQPTSSDPTTHRPPIQGRRTPPGQGQQHPATSSELPKTTGKGTTEKVILDGRRTAPVNEKKTTLTLPVTVATTLKEILSGRRWITPVRPVIPATSTMPAWIPTSSQSVETSVPATSITGTPSTVSSKKPTTPWELPMTTTAKIVLNGRRYRTPEKSGLDKVTTVTSTESEKTTGFSTADSTVFAPGSAEAAGKSSTGSSSVGLGVTTSVEIPFSSLSSTQATSSSSVSSSSQSSGTTSILATAEMASLTSDVGINEETTFLPHVETTESTKVTSTTAPLTDGPSSLEITVEKETTPLTSQQTFEKSTAQPMSTVTQGGASSTGTTGNLSTGIDEETVAQTTVGTTVTDGQSTSSKGPMATEMKATTIGQEKTTSASQSTTQKLEATSLPFSSAPWTTSESAVPSTSSQRSTKPTGSSPGPTTLKSTAAYGEGCDERCPQGTLSGSGRCYQIVPPAYQPSFHLSFSYCGRNRTGHLLEPAELRQDIRTIRPWLKTLGYDVNNFSLYLGPFASEGNKIYGMYTNLSRVGVELAPIETIKMSDVRNYFGICTIPEFCSTFNCSFGPLYDSLPGLLESPMPEPVVPGTTVRVQCLSPSDTVIQLRCDSFGKMTPRPGTAAVSCKISKSFGREKPVSDNKPVRKECDCFEQGTETCDAVEGGFKCACKRNWMKNTCWKSDDACWVKAGNPGKCNGKGTCHSYPDQYICKCESGFGGTNCQLPVNNCTWFGGPDSTPFLNAGKVAIVAVTSLEAVEMVLKVFIKCAALISTNGPTDPLSYTNAMRKYSVGVAGVMITLYGHPNFVFTLYGFGARLVFLLVNILMLWAFWCLIIESYITFCVYFGIGRNRWTLGVEKAKEDNWCESEEPEDKWYLDKSFMIYPGIIFAIVVELAIFCSFYDSIPSPYTTLGEISSLRSPAALANLLLMAIMSYLACGLGCFCQVAKKFYPGVMGEQRDYFEFHKGRVAIEVLNKVERCQWLQPFQAPVVFATYALAVWSQDQVATGLEQSLEFYISVVIIFCSVLISVVGTVSSSPWIYGHVMKFILPRLPWLKIWTVYTPAEHGYLNHDEVINRKKGKDVVLPENQGWPSHPSEDSYVSLERRHQCQRRLTRQYLEMRLMGVGKEDARELISARFKLAIIPEEDPEEEQWNQLLREWSEAVAAMDTTIFEIPRDRAVTREQYWKRILSANLFTRADVMRENSDWMRFLVLFQIMGHIPLEESEVEGEYPQIKHILQAPEFQSAWERISRHGTKKANRKMRKIAQKISPELFPNAKKIRKLRARARHPHTVLVNLPGVRRYLTVDFLNRFFFVSEQARFRYQEIKDQKFFGPSEERIKKIRIKVLKRRVVPQAITLMTRGEWLAGEDLITMSQPKAAALIGGNDQPRKAKKVPPLVREAIEIPAGVVEHNGIPTSLYRW